MKKPLYNRVTVQDANHLGGFVLLERIADRRWRAEQWSAFYIRLILPENCCLLYRDNEGRAVAELPASAVQLLTERLELISEQMPDSMTFAVPRNLTIPEMAFIKWRNNLPSTRTEK